MHLTSRAGFELIAAGQALATYQICGVVSRPIWRWLADTRMSARSLLIFQGLAMAVAAGLTGQFGPDWPVPAVLLVCALAGVTAGGYTGIAYGEFARLGGTRRTEATGLGSAAMFAGVLVLPSLATMLLMGSGSYSLAYGAIAVAAAVAGIILMNARS